MYIYIYIYIHMYILQVCIYTHTGQYIHVLFYTSTTNIISSHIYIYICMFICVYVYVHIYMHNCIFFSLLT